MEALGATPETVGFRTRTVLDESPEQREKTRLAVRRAKEGDQDALRYLYITYSHNVYSYVCSIIHDDHEAEDVTQQVFAKLMTRLAKYDDRGVPVFAWILRLARNAAIDHMRANRHTPVESVFDPDTPSGGDLEQSGAVGAAFATLPREQREVVLLRHVMGYTPGEIARRMGRSESSVHALHHRGRRALRRELERLGSAPLTRRNRSLAA
jgi:RNA polymerase sigma-70 factor (ECF subfamily)